MKITLYYYIYRSLDYIPLLKYLICLLFYLIFFVNMTECMINEVNPLANLEAEAKTLIEQIELEKKAITKHSYDLENKNTCFAISTTTNWFEPAVAFPKAEAKTISNTLTSFSSTVGEYDKKQTEIVSFFKGHHTAVVTEVETQSSQVITALQQKLQDTTAKLDTVQTSNNSLIDTLGALKTQISDLTTLVKNQTEPLSNITRTVGQINDKIPKWDDTERSMSDIRTLREQMLKRFEESTLIQEENQEPKFAETKSAAPRIRKGR